MTFGDKLYDFYINQKIETPLPEGIEVLNPYHDKKVKGYVRKFLDKFYNDNNKRTFIIGINPGRFGAGITGINFTDPVALKEHCGIDNDFPQKKELSSEFVYKAIDFIGGPKAFYNKYLLVAMSTLGYVKNGVNYNYYDDKELQKAVTPYVVENIWKQIEFGANRKAAVVMGTGKNFKFFDSLNKSHGFFDKTYVVEHPRYIMQYKRKQLNDYLKKYKEVFEEASSL